MSQQFNTQSIRTAKQVMSDVENIAAESRVDDWYDTTTLAKERMKHAESLFYAISVLLETTGTAAITARAHAARLADLGSMESGEGADIFHNQAEILDGIACAEGAAK